MIWCLVISARYISDEDFYYKNDNDNASEITRNFFLLLIISYGILIVLGHLINFEHCIFLNNRWPPSKLPGNRGGLDWTCSPASFPGSWGREEQRPWEWSWLRSPYCNIRITFFPIHIKEESKCSISKLSNVAVNDHWSIRATLA